MSIRLKDGMSIRLTNEWMTNKPGSKNGWV